MNALGKSKCSPAFSLIGSAHLTSYGKHSIYWVMHYSWRAALMPCDL